MSAHASKLTGCLYIELYKPRDPKHFFFFLFIFVPEHINTVVIIIMNSIGQCVIIFSSAAFYIY